MKVVIYFVQINLCREGGIKIWLEVVYWGGFFLVGGGGAMSKFSTFGGTPSPYPPPLPSPPVGKSPEIPCSAVSKLFAGRSTTMPQAMFSLSTFFLQLSKRVVKICFWMFLSETKLLSLKMLKILIYISFSNIFLFLSLNKYWY